MWRSFQMTFMQLITLFFDLQVRKRQSIGRLSDKNELLWCSYWPGGAWQVVTAGSNTAAVKR